MELRHLRYFVAVAEALSFTRAAERLRLAQPSLTRQARILEEELGVRLLDRGHNRIALTEKGRRFFFDAKKILALCAESVAALQGTRDESTALNIGYVANFRPLTPPLQRESTIAWRDDNSSQPLRDYIQIVKAKLSQAE